VTRGMLRAFRRHLGQVPAEHDRFEYWFGRDGQWWTWSIVRRDNGQLMRAGTGIGDKAAAEMDAAIALRDLCAPRSEAA
jgi:hypothetical protein